MSRRYQVRRWDSFWQTYTMVPIDFARISEAKETGYELAVAEVEGVEPSDIEDVDTEIQIWADSYDGTYRFLYGYYEYDVNNEGFITVYYRDYLG